MIQIGGVVQPGGTAMRPRHLWTLPRALHLLRTWRRIHHHSATRES